MTFSSVQSCSDLLLSYQHSHWEANGLDRMTYLYCLSMSSIRAFGPQVYQSQGWTEAFELGLVPIQEDRQTQKSFWIFAYLVIAHFSVAIIDLTYPYRNLSNSLRADLCIYPFASPSNTPAVRPTCEFWRLRLSMSSRPSDWAHRGSIYFGLIWRWKESQGRSLKSVVAPIPRSVPRFICSS